MWIELHQSLHRHPKTIAAAAALGVTRFTLVGHLSALWCWALDATHVEGGPFSAAAILTGAEWPEASAADFIPAMVEAGFVEVREDGYYLHDWQDYAGKLNQRREANAARMRQARASHVSRTSASRAPATEQNQTEPNLTVPNQISEPEAAPAVPAKPERFRSVPSTVRTRLWEVYTELTTRITPPPYEEDQFKHWEDAGCTVEHIDGALRETAREKRDKPWAFFKARLGDSLVRPPAPPPDGRMNHGVYDQYISRS